MSAPVVKVYLVDYIGPTLTDISNQVTRISIRRGRNRTTNKIDLGTADVVLYDQNGYWNPLNTSSPYYSLLTPMRKIVIKVTVGSLTEREIFTGYITNYDNAFATGVDDVSQVTLRCVDAYQVLANQTFVVSGSFAGQTSSSRVSNILNQIGWVGVNFPRSISTSQTTLQVDPGDTKTPWAALQQVADSEGGLCYVAKDGAITFLGRYAMVAQIGSTLPVLSDDGTALEYSQATVVYDNVNLTNKVTVERLNGTPQTASDATSISDYFERAGVRSNVLMQTDTVALDMAEAILNTRKQPEPRVDNVVFNVYRTGLAREIPIYADLGNAFLIKKRMPGNTMFEQAVIVDAFHHEITRDSFVSTLYTSEPLMRGFILDNPYSGRLDVDVFNY